MAQRYYFNEICNKKCPTNTKIDENNPKICRCIYSYILLNAEKNIVQCLTTDICPEESGYPLKINGTQQCVKDLDNCKNIKGKMQYVVNQICYDSCPLNMKVNPANTSECICE